MLHKNDSLRLPDIEIAFATYSWYTDAKYYTKYIMYK